MLKKSIKKIFNMFGYDIVLFNKIKSKRNVPLTFYPKNKDIKGHILFSYLADPLIWNSADERFKWHSNAWESKEIVKIFNDLGYVVDAINHDDLFYPERLYDVFFLYRWKFF